MLLVQIRVRKGLSLYRISYASPNGLSLCLLERSLSGLLSL